MQQSLFRGKAISLGSRCVWAILCLQEEVHSICHIWGHFVTLFCHVRRHHKNCHVWGCVRFAPIAPLRLSDLLLIRFPESQILHGCPSRCTWHSYSKLVKLQIHFKVWVKEVQKSKLTNKNAFILFLRKMECANASPSHQTNGQAGFMYTFLCCAVYSVVLYILSVLCGV